MFFFLLAVAAVAVAGAGAQRVTMERARPGARATTKLGNIQAKRVGEDEPGNGTYVGPLNRISVEDGWTPVFITSAHARILEWGACYYQWQEDLGKQYGKDSNWAVQHILKRVQTLMSWAVDASIVGWIVRRLCFQVAVPASAVKINGEWYFVPSSPRDNYLPTMRPSSVGGMALPGWNPGTTRMGFAAEFGDWPLEWPPPAGAVTGAWMRNLGDITGTGFDTWQLVTNQDGSERSFPMMTENGWRVVFGFSEYKWPGHANSQALSMFNNWRYPGAPEVEKGAATKAKADNRYRVPR